MIKRLIFIYIFGIQLVLVAADQEKTDFTRLNKSAPNKTASAPFVKRSKDRSSAPGRLSSEEKREEVDESLVSLEQADFFQQKKTLMNSPVQRSKFSPKLPPTKKPLFGSNILKFFFISADMFDEMLLYGIEKNRCEIKKIARSKSLTESSFYRIIKGMRPELMQASSDIVMFANYFLCMVASEDSCKDYLAGNSSLIPVQSKNFNVCVEHIRFYLDTVTHNAINWPDIKREEDKEIYYEQLLAMNKGINVSDVCLYYYGATVAIGLLSQIRDRSLNLKTQFTEISNSPKRAKRHCKELIRTFGKLAVFVPSLNVSFERVMQEDQQEHEDEE